MGFSKSIIFGFLITISLNSFSSTSSLMNKLLCVQNSLKSDENTKNYLRNHENITLKQTEFLGSMGFTTTVLAESFVSLTDALIDGWCGTTPEENMEVPITPSLPGLGNENKLEGKYTDCDEEICDTEFYIKIAFNDDSFIEADAMFSQVNSVEVFYENLGFIGENDTNPVMNQLNYNTTKAFINEKIRECFGQEITEALIR